MQLVTLLLILLVPIHPSYWLYKRLAYFGAFRSAFPSISTQFPSTDYFAIPEIIQAEDIAYHQPSGDLIFLGQDEGKKRYGWFPPLANFARPEDGHTSRAKLWAVDPQTWKPREIELQGHQGAFVTHGVDIFPTSSPRQFYLQAINHVPRVVNGVPQPISDSRIEVFLVDLDQMIAKHQSTLRHELVRTPNDIFALGPNELFVTNDHHNTHGHKRLAEDFLGWTFTSKTNIIHLNRSDNNGVEGKVVAGGLHNANGLGHGPNDQVMLGHPVAGYVTVYNHTRGMLRDPRILDFHVNLDNPTYYTDPYARPGNDASGIVLAGVTQGMKLAEHAHDSEANIPSAVWIVRERNGRLEKKMLFEDDGAFISGAATTILVSVENKEAEASGKKEVWAITSGFLSRTAVVIKVDLTDWAK